ncbi:hypothetical protein GO497_09640 [Acidovorax citrulli]|nr:hypothetical protein [Paracidovorax citrulli]
MSQSEWKQVKRARTDGGSDASRACSHGCPGTICRPLAERLSRAASVPPCGVPSVTTRCTRPMPVSPQARSQARTARPPMLWQITSGGRPVASVTRRTAASMVAA